MPRVRLYLLALALTPSVTIPTAAKGQQSAGWAGWARCQINVTGPGYTDQQTHTWMIGNGAPTLVGAFRVYPATWSVVGGGSLEKTEGKQTLKAEWATNTQDISAPIAVFVRASDKRVIIQARHSQRREAGGVQGYQQLTVDGKPEKPGMIAAESFEWTFPSPTVSRPRPGASLTASGSSTPLVNGSVGIMQPGGSRATASCTWNFNQGASPEPPPVISAPAIPKPTISEGRGPVPGT